MQPGCPQRLPLQSYLYRVIGEYRFLFIVALIQANAFTTPDIYSRNDFYCSLTPRYEFSGVLSTIISLLLL